MMSGLRTFRIFARPNRVSQRTLNIAQRRQGLNLSLNRGLPSSNQRTLQLKSTAAAMKSQVDALIRKTDPMRHQAMEQAARLSARMKAFESVPEFANTAMQTESEELRSIQQEVRSMEPILCDKTFNVSEVTRKVGQVDQKLEKLFQRTEIRLRRVEQDAVRLTVGQTFCELGYEVSETPQGVRAVKGRQCMWAKDEGLGHIVLEPASGFPNRSCVKEFNRLKDNLYRKGIILEHVPSNRHKPDKGGVLQKNATRTPAKAHLPYAAVEGDFGFDLGPIEQAQKLREVC